MRDSPTGTEGDWVKRAQRGACHGDPSYEAALVASGDSEGDGKCPRRGPALARPGGSPLLWSWEGRGGKEGALISPRPWACSRGGGE